MAMSGGVNSGTVYNMRGGRGGYYPSSRGGGGRGGRGKNSGERGRGEGGRRRGGGKSREEGRPFNLHKKEVKR